MGIRFLCPNGHKLNVKAELAGKRGSCPECGAKLTIPAATASSVATSVAAPPPAVVIEPAGAAAAWHVRSATGEQQGPLSELQFRAWIAAGRVTADTHLWREGWPEWKLARNVADLLPAPLVATPVAVAAPIPVTPATTVSAVGTMESVVVETIATVAPATDGSEGEVAIEPEQSSSVITDPAALATSTYVYKRSRNKQRQLTLAIFMFVAVVLLAAALYWVIRLNSAPAADSPSAELPLPAVSCSIPV